MEVLITVAGIIIVIIGLALLVWKICNSCNHWYKRIDTCNDKKMVLVCSRCGKIKKLKK